MSTRAALALVSIVSAAWFGGIAARAERPRAGAAAPPTFADDIAPIVYANCTVCHRPGQAAPFPLISFDEVRKHGKTIVDVISRRYMKATKLG